MTKWEYQIEPMAFDEAALYQSALDSKGRDGWELITVIPNVWGKDQMCPAAIYKRRQPRRKKRRSN